ncbi:MAG: family 78 glycoside hydrolase catalytic domain [Oscillospiraceae bacterium]
MESMKLTDLRTDYTAEPLGLDNPSPCFGWRFEGERQGFRQTAYHIVVRNSGGDTLWDSGRVESDRCQGIPYEGEALLGETAHTWSLTAWDESGSPLEASASFEMGLMGEAAWGDAQWIGSPELELSARALGIFRIETTFRIGEGGSCGGLVFGAADERLLHANRNTHLLEGENYIAYLVDVSQSPAKLHIYRVGYSPEDRADVPLASVDIAEFGNPGNQPITEANRHEFHTLAVEVYGNHAMAFIDGVLVDAVEEFHPFPPPGGIVRHGRQLNPAAINDIPTFPRLCQIGFAAGENTTASYQNLLVSNIRTPKAVLLKEEAKNPTLFPDLAKDGLFQITGEKGLALVHRDPSHGAAPILRREVTIEAGKALVSARLHVAARGIYEGYVGGEKIGDAWFQPDASQFDRHLYCKAYDITEMLRLGKNLLNFQLASGWWSDAQTFTLMNYNYFGDRPSLLAKLVLTYGDGSKEKIVTRPGEWLCSMEGPVRYAGFFQGETYDAGREAIYKTPGGECWHPAVEVLPVPIPEAESLMMWPAPNHTRPEIVAHIGEPVREIARIRAQSRTEVGPGVFVYDMGQNMAGVPRILLRGEKGQAVTLRYGEILYPHLPEYDGLEGQLLTENLRDAENNDVYICRGNADGEWFSPRFTFHGYRYLEVSGTDNPPAPKEVEGIVLSSIGAFTGGFSCSNDMVNKLYENIGWSQRANFISIPTDCPQRNERMGWMGDIQVFARTASYNADVQLFLHRFLQSVRDLQAPDGRYPNIAPVGGGFGGIAWESAGIIVPYELFRQYSDLRAAEENYPAMQAYLSYLEAHTVDGLVQPGVGMLGDWLATEMGTDNDLLWNAIAAYCYRLMAEMAAAVGKNDDADVYRSRFEALRAVWTDKFIDPASGKTRKLDGAVNDTQCSYALPLAYGLLEGEERRVAAGHLNRRTTELGFTLTTGFLGTGPICQALSENGYADTAYKLLQQTEYPSWLYSITQGATTIWERWNSYTVENGFGGNNNMNSFNHYSLGAVGAWLYGHVLGIRPQKAGYKEFLLEPVFGGMDHAEGWYDSPYGRIESGWRREGKAIRYRAVVPPNTRAKLRLPGMPEGTLMESGSHSFRVEL